MPDPVDLGYAMRQPAKRVVEYFEDKGYKFDWDWHETLGDAHAKSFVVAKAVRGDVLGTIHRQMQRAIKHGVSEAEFVRNLEINLKKLGWWGKQVVVDADGGAEMVQLGSPHRLRTIYNTNMRTATAHGRYRQQVENVDSRPYWAYRAIMDQHTRPTHAAMNGMVFRADDPIWRSHYPPNGFNCRCYVDALTMADVDEQELTIHDSADRRHDVMQDAGVDKRTGEVRQVEGVSFSFEDRGGKSHVMTPDPGWSYNPGFAGPGDRKVFLPRDLKIRQSAAQTVSKSMDEFYIPKLETRPQDIARTEIDDFLASSRLDDAVAAREVKGWPLAVISPDIEKAIASAGAVTASQVVTSRIGAGKFNDHPRLDAERLRNVQDALDYGELLIEPPYIPGKQGREHQGDHYTLLAYYEDNGTWWRHVIKIEQLRLAATTIFDDHDADVRTGEVLNRRGLIEVRPWNEKRWRNRPKAGR